MTCVTYLHALVLETSLHYNKNHTDDEKCFALLAFMSFQVLFRLTQSRKHFTTQMYCIINRIDWNTSDTNTRRLSTLKGIKVKEYPSSFNHSKSNSYSLGLAVLPFSTQSFLSLFRRFSLPGLLLVLLK